MSMTLTDAKTYVAKIKGLQNDSNALTLAGEAIAATYRKWNRLKNWDWLLKDTSSSTSVTGVTATASSATVSAPSTGALDFVNVGQTVTISSDDTATLAADTTVSSITRNSNGNVSSITLSASFGGSTDTDSTLTFSADIPIIDGTQEYNLPLDFSHPYGARMTVTNKGPLTYIRYREWNRKTMDQSIEGVPRYYTLYNPISGATQGYTRLRLFDVPGADDTLRLQYYRTLNSTATNIDIEDDHLYTFLDDARVQFLMVKDSDDPRLPALMKKVMNELQLSMSSDEEVSEDEDVRMIAQDEVWSERRPFYRNGPFDY